MQPGRCSRPDTLSGAQRCRWALVCIGQGKTGRAAAATLSPWSEAILRAYVAKLGADIAPNAPIFGNRSGRSYSKDTLGDDFRDVHATVDKADTRQLADMRSLARLRARLAAVRRPISPTRWRTASTPTSVCARSTTPSTSRRCAGSMRAPRAEQKPDESVRAPAVLTLFLQAPKTEGQ